MIVDILVRLPVKSLVRFRCASKHWLYLRTNPNFVKTHLKWIQSQVKSGIPMPSRVILNGSNKPVDQHASQADSARSVTHAREGSIADCE